MGLFRKPTDAYHAGRDLASLEKWLIRRRPWTKLPQGILRAIFENTRGHVLDASELRLARKQGLAEPQALPLMNFVVFCECHDVVRKNFLALLEVADQGPSGEEYALGMFGFSLYQWGSMFIKEAGQAQNWRLADEFCAQADFAFRSALLCDPFNLPAHVGMATLWGSMAGNKEIGLEWCKRSREAEQKLKTMSDGDLTVMQRIARAHLDPMATLEVEKEMARFAPDLLPHGSGLCLPTLTKVIDEIEGELLSDGGKIK